MTTHINDPTGAVQRLRDTAVALAKQHLPEPVVDQLIRHRSVGRRWRTRAKLVSLRAGELLPPHRPRILCWPEQPDPASTLHRVTLLHGWRLHNDPNAAYDAVILWEDATRREPDEIATELITRGRVINGACLDIGKQHVNKAFEAAFGYSLGVDPVSHVGPAVQKSDKNAQHDGVIVECPLEAPAPGMAYQRVVDNREDEGYIVWRVPVVGDRVPYVWHNVRDLGHRFEAGTFAYRSVDLVETHVVLSEDEIHAIIRFARGIGMDYGELDVLRDRNDQRIYVVDANPTPDGPPARATGGYDARAAHERLAHAFAMEFLPRPACDEAGRIGTLLLKVK